LAKSLYVVGCRKCGKTLICLALAIIFRDEGYRVGYFKPVGQMAKICGERLDYDVELMRKVLGLKEPSSILSPVCIPKLYMDAVDYAEARARIMETYGEVSKDKDIVLVDSADTPETLLTKGCSVVDLAPMFGSKVFVTWRYTDDSSIDSLALHYKFFESSGLDVVGSTLGFIPPTNIERVRRVASEALGAYGVKVLGFIPMVPELFSPTVKEVAETLGASVLVCEDNVDKVVETFLVGAMSAESALRWFRRSRRKAVVTGGDRTDLMMAALETDTSCLILTGGLHPDISVLTKAEERGVPVLVVPSDTYTTIMKLRTVGMTISPENRRRIELLVNLIRRNLDWETILRELLPERDNA